jgi:hypothetical protein
VSPPLHACLFGFLAGPQTVLNGVRVIVKATPARGRSRPSLDSHRTTAQTGAYQRGERCGAAREQPGCGDRFAHDQLVYYSSFVNERD